MMNESWFMKPTCHTYNSCPSCCRIHSYCTGWQEFCYYPSTCHICSNYLFCFQIRSHCTIGPEFCCCPSTCRTYSSCPSCSRSHSCCKDWQGSVSSKILSDWVIYRAFIRQNDLPWIIKNTIPRICSSRPSCSQNHNHCREKLEFWYFLSNCHICNNRQPYSQNHSCHTVAQGSSCFRSTARICSSCQLNSRTRSYCINWPDIFPSILFMIKLGSSLI